MRDENTLKLKSSAFGQSFEHFIILKVRAFLSYRERPENIYYWRSVNKQEVDLLIGREWAIEIKSTSKVSQADFRGLRALKEEGLFKNYLAVTLDPFEQTTEDGIQCVNYKNFLDMMWKPDLSS